MPTTTWMSLSLPTPSVSPGPAWAQTVNDALTAVDRHDHSSGYGKPIRSAALSIDADVSWGGFNLTTLRSARFASQASVLSALTDINCLSVVLGDLHYRNAAGQDVRITSGAGLDAASIGAIGGDFTTSGAAVTYLSASKSFIFTQAAGQAASLDAGNVILREPGVSSAKGITLQSPSGLAADYNLILPTAVPAATLPLVMAASGQVSTASALGNLTGLTLVSGNITLSGAAQSITKSGGSLTLGTSDSNDVVFNRNGSAALTLGPSGPAFAGKPTAAATVGGDGATTLATKGYVEGLFASTDNTAGLSYATGWSDAGGTYLKKTGNLVTLALNVQYGGGGDGNILTLPTGYRPVAATFAAGVDSTAGAVAELQAITSTAGRVRLNPVTAISGHRYAGTLTFFTA